jgi:hypothetical protein
MAPFKNILNFLIDPSVYIFLFLFYITLRHIIWIILPHLLALLALIVFYGIYNSIRAQYFNEKTQYRAKLFLQRNNLRESAHSGGYPVSQYHLASKQYWERAAELKKKRLSISLDKVIRNPSMELMINEFLDLLTRDFILNWYKPYISADNDFPQSILSILRHVVMELYSRAETIDMTQLILIKICGILINHAKDFQNAERLLRASRIPSNKSKSEMDRLFAQHYCQGKLHPAISATISDTTEIEYIYLRKKLKPLIAILLPRKDASNKMVLALVRELLVTCILRPMILTFSDPDYWNQNFDIFVHIKVN